MEKAAYANVMNMPCSMLTLTVAVLAATVLLVGLLYLIFATLHRGQPGRMVRRPKWLSVPKLALVSRKNRPNAPRATKSAKLHRYPLSIFYFEGYKHLRLKTILLVAVIALLNYGGIMLLTTLGLGDLFSKILMDIILFFLSYRVQNTLVFRW